MPERARALCVLRYPRTARLPTSRFAQGMGALVAGSPTLGRDSTSRTKRLRGWRAGGAASPGSPRFTSRVFRFTHEPAARRPPGLRQTARQGAQEGAGWQGRPTGAAVTLQAPRRSLGGPPGRQEAPTGRAGRQRPPIRSQEVATARQGARRRHEAGRSARGRPMSPRRSPTRLSARPVYRTGTLFGSLSLVGWTATRCQLCR